MSPFGDVDIYEDGWIFLLGGSNSVSRYWIDGEPIDKGVLSDWLKLYKNRISFFENRNISYLSVFAPEKLSVYKEKTPFKIDDSKIPSKQLREYLQGKINDDKYILDLIPFLRTQSLKFQTYHKTDSHWNFVGAFSAYQLIQSKLKEPVFVEALSQPKVYGWGTLDLGGKFSPPLKERVYYYKSTENISRVYANDLVQLKEREGRENDPGLHVGSYVVFRNRKPLSSKTLMIFGDSFSEYRDHLLTGLMAETYAEVHFIWNSCIDFSLVEKVRPDIVLTELAERFIPRSAPKDIYSYNE